MQLHRALKMTPSQRQVSTELPREASRREEQEARDRRLGTMAGWGDGRGGEQKNGRSIEIRHYASYMSPSVWSTPFPEDSSRASSEATATMARRPFHTSAERVHPHRQRQMTMGGGRRSRSPS